MSRVTNSWQADGHAFGATLIHYAVEQTELMLLEGHSKTRFIREFLVLCRVGLGLFGVGNRPARSILAGIDEEFDRFDPKWDDQLVARQRRYFGVLENALPASSGSDLFQCLVDDWTGWVDAPRDVAPWAFGLLGQAHMIFMALTGLIGPHSASSPTEEPGKESSAGNGPQTVFRRCRGGQRGPG